MSDFERIKSRISAHKDELKSNYYVSRIGVFGSYVRGEQKRSSDLDLLVDFLKPVDLIKFMLLEEYLTGVTGRKVDLVMKGALKPYIGNHILKEVVYL